MAKRKKTNWLGIGIGTAFVLAIYQALKGEQSTDSAPGQNQSISPPGTTVTNVQQADKAIDYNLVLKQGSEGAEVAMLQKLIGAEADGKFGPKTQAALHAATGLYQASINQATRIIQDKAAMKATQSEKNAVIFKYPFNKPVMAAVDVKAPIYQNRNGIWQNTDTYGRSLGHVLISKGMDIGLIEGWYEYSTPWIIVRLRNNFSWNNDKIVILKGSWIQVGK